jgi:hypothetical protein
MLVLNEIFYAKKKYDWKWYFVTTIIIILQITLTYSGVGLFLLLIFVITKIFNSLMRNRRMEYFITLGVVVLAILSIYIQKSFPLIKDKIESNDRLQSRSSYIMEQVVDNPIAFTKNDLSVSLRIFNPVIAIYGGIFERNGFGMGLGTISNDMIPSWLSNIIGLERTWGGQIMGGFVTSVYELGVVGIFFIFVIARALLISVWGKSDIKGALLVSLTILFLPTLFFGSLAFPLLGYILGIHLYYNYKNKLN